MINCPNCDKQIADDSAHCGYCGHSLEEQNKKETMFGMAALGGDELQEAVQQAKEAKKERQQTGGDQPASAGKSSGLNIPRPEDSEASVSTNKGASKLPKPGQNKPSSADQSSAASGSPSNERGEAFAKTERIDVSGGGPTGPDGGADRPNQFDQPAQTNQTDQPDQPDQSTPSTPAAASGASLGEPGGPGAATDQPAGPPDDSAAQVDPSAQADQVRQDGIEVHQANPQAGPPPAGPVAGGPGEPAGPIGPVGEENQQMMAGQSSGKKSRKGLIIAAIVAVAVIGGGCVLTVGWYVWDTFL